MAVLKLRNIGLSLPGPAFLADAVPDFLTVGPMPPRTAQQRHSGLRRRVFLLAFAWSVSPLAGQELVLQRDYPGSGPYECLAPVVPVDPSPEERDRAGQLASDAEQATILGDLERARDLFSRAAALDLGSAEFAYRHARVLQNLGESSGAMAEYCRVLELGSDATIVNDASEQIDQLDEVRRSLIPEAAQFAFRLGVEQADSSFFDDAISSFTIAMEESPGWAAPVYNRGMLLERVGRLQEALADFRYYLELNPDAPEAVVVISERIGLLEGAASIGTRSPGGALVLGVIPGMGHYYTGRPVGGTVTLALAGGAIAAGLLFKNITTLCTNDVPAGEMCPTDLVHDEITERPYIMPAVGIAAAVTVIGAIEALVRARQRRAQAEALIAPVDPGTGPRLLAPSVSTCGNRVEVNLLRVTFF